MRISVKFKIFCFLHDLLTVMGGETPGQFFGADVLYFPGKFKILFWIIHNMLTGMGGEAPGQFFLRE